MTRPAGRVRIFSKACGLSRLGSGGIRNLTGRIGSGQEVFKSLGSGQVTSTRADPREVTRPMTSPQSFLGLDILQLLACGNLRSSATWRIGAFVGGRDVNNKD